MWRRRGRERRAVFEATYQKGYVAHAPLEPHAAVAEVKEGRATVWASTQTPFPTRDRVAKALGLDPEQVRVITPFLGGGFGGKSADGQAVEAARLAQITGKPVQVAWTRAEEFFNDTFDPASVVKIVSGLDSERQDLAVGLCGVLLQAIVARCPATPFRMLGFARPEGASYGRPLSTDDSSSVCRGAVEGTGRAT